MWATKPYRQAVELQKRIMEESENAEGLALANLAKAFGSLELLKLRMRMRPAPKPVDVSKPRRSQSTHALAPVESAPDVQDQ